MADADININERTTVSLFSSVQLLWVAVPLIFAFALVYFRGEANAEKIVVHTTAMEKFLDVQLQMAKDIAEIKGLLQGRK